MTDDSVTARRLVFDDFRFEPAMGQLWRGADEIKLTPRCAAVLHVLIGRAGKVVSKEDLFEHVWDGRAVADDALTSCVQELRHALGDDARQPRYIETRHRRGYRFIASMGSVVEDCQVPVPAAQSSGRAAWPLVIVFPISARPPGHELEAIADYVGSELAQGLWRTGICRVAMRAGSAFTMPGGHDARRPGNGLYITR